MAAKPPRRLFDWWAEYQVYLLPPGASLEEAVEQYLTSVRDPSDSVLDGSSGFVLEGRERVVVGGSTPGYLLHGFHVEYAPDMESIPITGETVLFTVTERDQMLQVRYRCLPRRCGFENVAIRSVMKSLVPQ
ncbi:hypothetical protein [Nonomuraea sp. KM90]|uniref:hypothetical protein n=1 Tax=Nonomuraea sp. KM90 TaxID=3457428 RepID=UPI003FCE94F2